MVYEKIFSNQKLLYSIAKLIEKHELYDCVCDRSLFPLRGVRDVRKSLYSVCVGSQSFMSFPILRQSSLRSHLYSVVAVWNETLQNIFAEWLELR